MRVIVHAVTAQLRDGAIGRASVVTDTPVATATTAIPGGIRTVEFDVADA